jgi:hypothetical protein
LKKFSLIDNLSYGDLNHGIFIGNGGYTRSDYERGQD